MHNWHLNTWAVQGAYEPKVGEPRVLPLFQSTTYKYQTSKELADLFMLETNGHIYSRISNPTVDALEKKITALEGGKKTVCFSSGAAATAFSLLNLLQVGDNFLCSSSIYGGSHTLFTYNFQAFGIEIRFFNEKNSIEDICALADENTKAIFAETISNPSLEVLDLDKIVAIAKQLNVPSIVDNTFATPVFCRPLDYGINIVIHSTSKYFDGHAQSIGGAVVDGGTYLFKEDKFPAFCQPDLSYNGIIYTEKFPDCPYAMKLNLQMIRNFGATLSPFHAYLTHLGLETLALRMERHAQNALAVANYLKQKEEVSFVHYPYLDGFSEHSLAKKYLSGGSGVVTFGLVKGKKACEIFCTHLQLAALVVHVADVRTSILHPASTTHAQLNEKEQAQAGISPSMLRISVGIEHIDDIIKDLDQAFTKMNDCLA